MLRFESVVKTRRIVTVTATSVDIVPDATVDELRRVIELMAPPWQERAGQNVRPEDTVFACDDVQDVT